MSVEAKEEERRKFLSALFLDIRKPDCNFKETFKIVGQVFDEVRNWFTWTRNYP